MGLLPKSKKATAVVELPAMCRPPPGTRRPVPCPINPIELDWLSSDSDDGFNICKNRERVARLANIRKGTPASAASGASEADVPPESNCPTSRRSEGDEEEEGRGEEEGKGDEEGQDEEEDEGDEEGQDEEDEGQDEEDEGDEEGQDEEEDKGDEEGQDEEEDKDDEEAQDKEDGVIRYGLDPNGSDVQDVLRHGPLCYEEGDDGSEADASTTPANEGAELPRPDNPVHKYNYNEWFRYIGDPMEEGEQTNVDKLTRYRIRGDREWLPIPEGLRTPCYLSYQEEEVRQHLLACNKLGSQASNFKDPRIPDDRPPTARPSNPVAQPSNASAKAARSTTPPPSQPRRPASASQRPTPAVSNAPASTSARTLVPTQASDTAATRFTNMEKDERILRKLLHHYDAETEQVRDEFLRLNGAEKQRPSRSSPIANQASSHGAKNAAPSTKVDRRRLRQTLIELGMANVPDTNMEVNESEPSRSDYSETEKDARRRRGAGSESEESEESEDEKDDKAGGECLRRGSKRGGEDSSESSEDVAEPGGNRDEVDERTNRGEGDGESGEEGEAAEAAAAKSKGKGKAKEAAMQGPIEKGKGRQNGSKSGAKGTLGQPGKEQIQAVKELQRLIKERIADLSNEFNASQESLYSQLGMGRKFHQKTSLFNLFSQVKSLEQPLEGVHGCSYSLLTCLSFVAFANETWY